jgi:kynurenine formamidase
MIPGTTSEDYPDGEAAAAEWVTLTTHNGTHLDAPWHFHSTQDAKLGGAKPSITIDQVPLEWCFQPGVKLDFRHFPDGYVATAADVESRAPSHRLRTAAAGHRHRQHARRRRYGHNGLRRRRVRHGL